MDGINVLFAGGSSNPLEGAASLAAGKGGAALESFGGALDQAIQSTLQENPELADVANQITQKIQNALNGQELSLQDILNQFDQMLKDLGVSLDGNLAENLDVDKMLTQIEAALQDLDLPDAKVGSMMSQIAERLDSVIDNAMRKLKEGTNEILGGALPQQVADALDRVVTEVGEEAAQQFNPNDGSKSRDMIPKALQLKEIASGQKVLVQEDASADSDNLLNASSSDGKLSDLFKSNHNPLKHDVLSQHANSEGDKTLDLEQKLASLNMELDAKLTSESMEKLGANDLDLLSSDAKAMKIDSANVNQLHSLSNLSHMNRDVTQARQALVPLEIQGKPGTAEFKSDLSERVVFMAKNDLNGASIKLNPPELGPVEINIKINHNRQADLMITTQHTLVRDSVESALPRLREALAESGIQLNNVNVGDQSARQHNGGQAFAGNSDSQHDSSAKSDFFREFFGESGNLDSGQELLVKRGPSSLVDFYA